MTNSEQVMANLKAAHRTATDRMKVETPGFGPHRQWQRVANAIYDAIVETQILLPEPMALGPITENQ